MMREYPVRFCERLEVKLLHSTRPIICCQFEGDANRIRQALGKRLEKFELQLNEEKTKLVPFSKRAAAQGIQQGTFDFLGFTFYWGVSRKGRTIPKMRTKAKTLRVKLKRVNEWAKQIRNERPLNEIWKTLKAKLRGHIQYYGISHNFDMVKRFIEEAKRIMFKWLNRRSQRKSFSWEKFLNYMKRNPLPEARILHRMF